MIEQLSSLSALLVAIVSGLAMSALYDFTLRDRVQEYRSRFDRQAKGQRDAALLKKLSELSRLESEGRLMYRVLLDAMVLIIHLVLFVAVLIIGMQAFFAIMTLPKEQAFTFHFELPFMIPRWAPLAACWSGFFVMVFLMWRRASRALTMFAQSVQFGLNPEWFINKSAASLGTPVSPPDSTQS